MKRPDELVVNIQKFSYNAIAMATNMKGLIAEIDSTGGIDQIDAYWQPGFEPGFTAAQIKDAYQVLATLANSVDAANTAKLFAVSRG